MTWNLISKELREHWLPLTVLCGFSFLALALVTLGSIVTEEAGNILEALRSFLLTFSIPIALVISNRLVVREYQGKTQLFLESLPLTRARMIAVKYVLGLVIMAGFAAISLAMLLPMVAYRQQMTARFIAIVALRGIAFTFLVYSFFFVTGMLGRYRMAIYAAIFLGVLVLSMTTDMELNRFGPFALMDKTFPYEREVFPVEHLAVTFGLGAAFSALSFALALTREGSAAAMLAEKMSHREKMFVTATLLGIMFLGTLFGKKPEKYPFDLPEAVGVSSSRADVKVEPGWEVDLELANAFASEIHETLAGAAQYLGLERTPPVFITTRRDLDANRYERGELVKGEGVLVRVNLSAKGFDHDQFRMWLIREVLLTATEGRVGLESKSWVLDGFGPFWVKKHSPDNPPASLAASDRQLALRALYGTSAELSTAQQFVHENDLRGWFSFREHVGDGIAAGVAWSGLDVLSRRLGPERTRNFLRAVLATPVPADFRALWFERRNSIEQQLENAANMPMTEFLAAWRSELETARATFSAEVARLPRVRGELWFEPLSAETRTVRYRMILDREQGGAVPRVRLMHADLPAFQTAVAPHEWQREDVVLGAEATGELAGTWPRGAQFYWTFMAEVPDLGCDVISGWDRREIQ